MSPLVIIVIIIIIIKYKKVNSIWNQNLVGYPLYLVLPFQSARPGTRPDLFGGSRWQQEDFRHLATATGWTVWMRIKTPKRDVLQNHPEALFGTAAQPWCEISKLINTNPMLASYILLSKSVPWGRASQVLEQLLPLGVDLGEFLLFHASHLHHVLVQERNIND